MEQNHKTRVEELNKKLDVKDEDLAGITKEKDQAITDTKRREEELRVSEEKAEKLKA